MTKQDISTKNTKNEILDAYNEVFQQLREERKSNKQEMKREQDKQEIITMASKHTTSDIVKNLADLKLSMVNSLESLGHQMLNEHKKLTVLQQAIEIQSKELEEIHDIKVNTDTLAALFQTQKQKKESFDKESTELRDLFEKEMKEKRTSWKKEQEEVELLRKEQESQQKKLRQREEEEYVYKRDLERQKERDQYESNKQLLEKELVDKKASFEKEMSDRQAALLTKENEYQQLTSQVAEFPAKLHKAIEETEKRVTEKSRFQYEHENKLIQKEIEGERKLHQQMVSALEAKISQQEKQIKELTDKANFAGNQVQEIAVKAIEGASRQLFYPSQTLQLQSSDKF